MKQTFKLKISQNGFRRSSEDIFVVQVKFYATYENIFEATNFYRIDSRSQSYRFYLFVARKIFSQCQSTFRSLTKIYLVLRRNNLYRIGPRIQSYISYLFVATKIFSQLQSIFRSLMKISSQLLTFIVLTPRGNTIEGIYSQLRRYFCSSSQFLDH